jgi:hypothetical protein
VPAWRYEIRREVGERREHEEALLGLRVRDDQETPVRTPAEVADGGQGQAFGRSFDDHSMATEQEQVEIQLPRPPPDAGSPPERTLEALEGDEETQRRHLRVGPRWYVEGDDRVSKLGLVRKADGLGRVQVGHAGKPGAGQRPQGSDCLREGRGSVAEVRTQAEVRADASRSSGAVGIAG